MRSGLGRGCCGSRNAGLVRSSIAVSKISAGTLKMQAGSPPLTAHTHKAHAQVGGKDVQGGVDKDSLEGPKQGSPVAERNKGPILEVLQQYLPSSGQVLEVASGSGQHVAHFAANMSQLNWQPSDLTDELFASVVAYCSTLANVALPPLLLDASNEHCWESLKPSSLAAVCCINMCHISPWAATTGMISGAGRVLQPGGVLYVYGPFQVGGQFTTESNAAFDQNLRQRNPQWGYRDIADMDKLAEQAGLSKVTQLDMPANNFSLVYRKNE